MRLPISHSLRRLAAPLALVTLLAGVAEAQTPRPPRKGSKVAITIESSPPGASIYLDSKDYGLVGYTPFSTKLNKGDYQLILELRGFQTKTVPITVKKRKQVFANTLDRETVGTLEIVAPSTDDSAVGANVTMDGQNVGTVPAKLEATAGRHQVLIQKEGYNAYTEWVDVKASETRTMSITLKKAASPKGSILVSADVDSADVAVDGQPKGTTPMIVPDLEPGPHVVAVSKAGMPEWKQTVNVVSGETIKVSASIKGQMPQAGSIKVLSNADGAEVYLDGELKGNTPVTIPNVPPGTHILEVKAKDFEPGEQELTVVAGQELVKKVVLVAKVKPTTGGVSVVSAEPGADVIVDGSSIGTSPASTDKLAPGPHKVVVKKAGFKDWKKDITVVAGETVQLTAELSAAAHIKFASTPSGAGILIDDKRIGETPFETDLEPGTYRVTYTMDSFMPKTSELQVLGGKDQMVDMQLEVMMTGPSDDELLMEERRLTSFGARVIKPGKFTADVSAGYPYMVEGRLSVGAVDNKAFGLDASVVARAMYFNVYELALGARLRLLDKMPFAFAAFGEFGGGDGRNGRNTFYLNAGGVGSLTFQDKVTVSARAYANIYSDRLCPETEVVDDDEARGCHLVGDTPEKLAELEDLKDAVGDDKFRTRDGGVRFMVSMILEVAFSQKRSFFLIFEGPPFQSQRAAFKKSFNKGMFEDDLETYVRAGITLKF
ncbi:MAG: PEGA domain-containing protein [Deltaproteobacteria bacterium]|nr:PEGA domain-containing protein [Deltaproteobacteria bacterium]